MNDEVPHADRSPEGLDLHAKEHGEAMGAAAQQRAALSQEIEQQQADAQAFLQQEKVDFGERMPQAVAVVMEMDEDQRIDYEDDPDALRAYIEERIVVGLVGVETIDKEASDKAFAARAEALQASGSSNAEIINILVTEGLNLPTEERQRLGIPEDVSLQLPEKSLRALQDFQALLHLRDVPEADRAVLRGLVDTTPLDFGNLRGSFDAVVDTALASDSGLSKAGRDAVAETFRPETPNTGSDVNRETDRTTTDPNTGEQVPLYNADNPLRIRENVDAYINNQGDRVIQVRVPDDVGGFRVMRVGFEGMSGEDVGEYANFMITLQVLEHMGLTDLYGKGFEATQGSQDMPIYPATDIAHMKDVVQALVHGFSGDNGAILSQAHIDQMHDAAQWFSPKGDAVEGDFNRPAMRRNLKGLGIMNPDSQVIWENWRIAGDFIQTNYGHGKPDYDTLKAHMEQQLGRQPDKTEEREH